MHKIDIQYVQFMKMFNIINAKYTCILYVIKRWRFLEWAWGGSCVAQWQNVQFLTWRSQIWATVAPLVFKSHVCQNVRLLAISSRWVGVSIVGWRIMLKIGSKTSYILHNRSAVTRLLLQSRQNYFPLEFVLYLRAGPVNSYTYARKRRKWLNFKIAVILCIMW